ncbi:hypothetical protein scyTo_0024933 [Scyliorhinus torazame]|uniref:Uncharacterized protein n=1 Tax=Scyliorhinus torazame TaxID=75743 RepID=A0A401QG04_SCYTO|nr:hypothetical protein [Scyliorhinus torazame]
MKRALKEPITVPQTGFLQTDLSQNNTVVYGMPSDYMKQQFNSYSLPQLLPRQLVPFPSEQRHSPVPVYPGLGKFQSTAIKSGLQYTNQYVNFSIKKEAIALSSGARARANEDPADFLKSQHPNATRLTPENPVSAWPLPARNAI